MAKIPSKDEAKNIIDLTLSDEEDTEVTQSSLTYDKVKEELESSDEELNMHVEDKNSMISPAYLLMPPPNKYLRPDPGQETSYSGTTESYSHSDETYVSIDVTDPEPNSSSASTPASTPELQRKTLSPEELQTDIKLLDTFNLHQQLVQVQVMHNMMNRIMICS